MLPIITVVSAIIFGIICFKITKKRNTNEYIWGGLGVLLGPIVIPFCFIPKKKKEFTVESEANE